MHLHKPNQLQRNGPAIRGAQRRPLLTGLQAIRLPPERHGAGVQSHMVGLRGQPVQHRGIQQDGPALDPLRPPLRAGQLLPALVRQRVVRGAGLRHGLRQQPGGPQRPVRQDRLPGTRRLRRGLPWLRLGSEGLRYGECC